MTTDERRRFFRINDSMGIAWRELGSEEEKLLAAETRSGSRGVDFAANFDNRIYALLDSCRVQSPLVAEVLDLINKKLNFVIRQLEVDANLLQQMRCVLREVNISACGLAFESAEPLVEGRGLQLDLELYPQGLRISVVARVQACESLPVAAESQPSRYRVRLAFVEIHPNDQEVLIQHIVKRQGNQLKLRRQQRNDLS